MSEQTQTTAVENPGATEIVRQIKRKVADTTQLLRAQADLLRQRGVTLPPTAAENLKNLKTRVDTLERTLNDSSNELRSLRALARTTALINSAQSTDVVLNQVMDTVIELTRAERGYIMLVDAKGELEFRVARGIDLEEDVRGDGSSSKVVSLTIVKQVARTGETVLTDNASADASYNNNLSIAGFQLRSILCVPLKLRDQVIGVVYCDNRFVTGLFKASDQELMSAFANQAAVAIENARLFETTRLRLNEVTAIRDRMDNIFTSIESGIITVNADLQVMVCNSAAERIVGTELIGRKLSDVLPPMSNAFSTALEFVATRNVNRSVECQPETSKGVRSWRFNISPLTNDSGRGIGLALVLDDITDQRASESQLDEVQRYLPAGLVKKGRQIDTGAQEREITAIFSDVRGFTTFSEKLQPQELMTVINKYLALASDAINFVEGVVDKYMGDAVTGLFNTQLNPQDDHAARAVQAALQLISDLRAQHEILPDDERLFYGIGIHTGPAVLGIVGGKTRKEFSALGEASDVAKYLQEQAGKGEIIISEDTYQLVKNQYECELQTEIVRPKAGYEHLKFYRVIKRKKGGISSFIDKELLDLLGDLNLEN
jgi:class 3 adenylate cyclase